MESYHVDDFKRVSIISYHEQVILPIPFSSSRNCHLKQSIPQNMGGTIVLAALNHTPYFKNSQLKICDSELDMDMPLYQHETCLAKRICQSIKKYPNWIQSTVDVCAQTLNGNLIINRKVTIGHTRTLALVIDFVLESITQISSRSSTNSGSFDLLFR